MSPDTLLLGSMGHRVRRHTLTKVGVQQLQRECLYPGNEAINQGLFFPPL